MNQGYNRVTLFGNLGGDPELRRLQSGKALLRMRLATNTSWLNKEGVREERTEWHTVLVWGGRAEGLARILKRGSFLLVEGTLRTHSYEKDGEKRYATEVHADDVILGGRRRPTDPADGYGESEGDADTCSDAHADAHPDVDMHLGRAAGGRRARRLERAVRRGRATGSRGGSCAGGVRAGAPRAEADARRWRRRRRGGGGSPGAVPGPAAADALAGPGAVDGGRGVGASPSHPRERPPAGSSPKPAPLAKVFRFPRRACILAAPACGATSSS
jgi:single-strand DNA-binding protein